MEQGPHQECAQHGSQYRHDDHQQIGRIHEDFGIILQGGPDPYGDHQGEGHVFHEEPLHADGPCLYIIGQDVRSIQDGDEDDQEGKFVNLEPEVQHRVDHGDVGRIQVGRTVAYQAQGHAGGIIGEFRLIFLLLRLQVLGPLHQLSMAGQ